MAVGSSFSLLHTGIFIISIWMIRQTVSLLVYVLTSAFTFLGVNIFFVYWMVRQPGREQAAIFLRELEHSQRAKHMTSSSLLNHKREFCIWLPVSCALIGISNLMVDLFHSAIL
ncbi:hypothetical protein BX666DRAFT_1970754 [Dichotomocladium elegans]|nr:hypothetical protein BX666DRAFT_1970754 [Dichotomocladium elegans]